MLSVRVIPCLLLHNSGIVKTIKFKKPRYIGDPINVVKILNEKEVDELVFLDIDASKKKIEPNYQIIEEIANECFMPFGYGGGITNLSQADKLFSLGVEKVIIGSEALNNVELIKNISKKYGSQSVVVSINVKSNIFGKRKLYNPGKTRTESMDIRLFSKLVVENGAGEIFLNSVDRDGTKAGFDKELIKQISSVVNVPVTVCGGAGQLSDFKDAVEYGASAVSAGSLFVYHGKRDAVLVNYPKYQTLQNLLK
ncbi:MAG: imidazole glycerol phosphate synthase subunit HisF [Alteromonadales bacterium]|nr:imidazole glycerol phosphate synthase subunit HisF [Alteromonadales bacterium]